MKRIAPLWMLLALLVAPVCAREQTRLTFPKEFTAHCIGVSDGDTLKILAVSGETKYSVTIRLYGIDAPEKKQAYGTQSKKALSALAFDKDLKIYTRGNDRYGRLLAWLFVGSTCLNSEMVRQGAAWWYRKYAPKETTLQALESEARQEKRGLWSDATAVPPWEFRKPK